MCRSAVKYPGFSVALFISAESAFVAGPLADRSTSWGDIWPFILIFLGVFLISLVVVAYREKLRSDKLDAFAKSLGLTYRPNANSSDADLAVGSHLGEIGHSKMVSNILEATQTPELAFTLFDYKYTFGYGRSSEIRQQTVSRMQSSLLRLPAFILFPENFLFRIGDAITGRKDIDFADSPVFSKVFVLRGEDEPAVRALFSPKLRQAFEGTPKLTIEGKADRLFIFRNDHRIEPEEFSATIEQDKKILRLLFEAQQESGSVG